VRRSWLWVGSLTILGAVLRFATLDAKGFWVDEGLTVLRVRNVGFFDVLANAPQGELTPPLYTGLAWLWERLFGHGEVAMRSLPALFGTAAIPVAYFAGRELVSHRTGLIVAALVSVNPLLIWYSQEARPYSLFVLLSALAVVFFARALREPRRADLLAWAGVSTLAVAAHYFGLFLFVAQAAWLLWTYPRLRALRWGVAIPALAGLVLSPLLVYQYFEHADNLWIRHVSLGTRTTQVGGFFLVGFELPWPEALFAAVAAAALAALGLFLLRRAAPEQRRGALVAASLAAAVVALPLALAVLGVDVFLYRNVIPALIPAAIAVAAGFAAARRLGTVGAIGLCSLSLAVVLATGWTPKYRRETWREASEAIGQSAGLRAIVATPNERLASRPLRVYLSGVRRRSQGAWPVSEVVVVALPDRPLGAFENPRLPRFAPHRLNGFEIVERRRTDDYLLVRYRAPHAQRPTVTDLEETALDPGESAVWVSKAAVRGRTGG
jgi:4-amino-4-deoxy-L-arabinose transferase-like glycosyltransferase